MIVNSRKQQSVNEIAETLEREIVLGKLKANQRLVETEVSKRFEVSRTPVREAMRKLESSGFVIFVPHKGWRVKEISLKEVEEIYVIRANLSFLSTKIACNNLSQTKLAVLEKVLEGFESAVKSNNVSRYFDLNVRFHCIIEEASKNNTLVKMLNSLDKITLRYRFLSLSLPDRLAQSLNEHSKIVEALRNKNKEEAGMLAQESALNAGRLLIEYLSKNSSTFYL